MSQGLPASLAPASQSCIVSMRLEPAGSVEEKLDPMLLHLSTRDIGQCRILFLEIHPTLCFFFFGLA